MNIQKISFTLGIIFFVTVHATESYLPVRPEQLMLDYIGTGKHYYVQYLKDFKNNNHYLMKQKNDNFSVDNKALQAVREALGTFIANECSIPGQQVWIIPAHISFIGKSYENTIATLHTIVPGKMIKETSQWHHLDIRMRKEKMGGWTGGLLKHIITNMSEHQDLSRLVALDTMTGNGGRHNKNFFYDEKTKSFYFIDMGGCFKSDQVEPTIRNVEKMLSDPQVKFSKKELSALKSYSAALKHIYEVCPYSTVVEKLSFFLEKASLSAATMDYINHSIIKKLKRTYALLPQLLLLIDTLLYEKGNYIRWLPA